MNEKIKQLEKEIKDMKAENSIAHKEVKDDLRFLKDNMFDPNARSMTHLTREEWIHIMENYNKLKTKYEPKEV